MALLHTCVNCGDPAPNSWLCPVCETIKEQAKQQCFESGRYWGNEINAAVYAALTQYREKKHDLGRSAVAADDNAVAASAAGEAAATL